MRVFWWQAGLHLEPQSESERDALLRLQEALMLGLGREVSTNAAHDETRPVVEARNKNKVVLIHDGV